MSITPIEGDSDHQPPGQSDATAPSGVWGRLRAAVRWLRTRLPPRGSRAPRRDHGSDRTGSVDADVNSDADSISATKALSEPSAARPVARPALPSERTDIDTERAGDSVRVFDPDDPEAYITSDTWMSVER